MAYYQKHIFVCTNQKSSGKVCCASQGGVGLFDYLKEQLKKKNLHGPGKIRVSQSGCLGRCRLGPCMVIYPEGVWYSCNDFSDIDELIGSHLQQGSFVERLLIEENG